ncbi:hypothetical protein CANCADRAFT_106047 [Tortispora caseinolytica NRRL Y-17796]|uniref:Uncharacterized protein n=1 Tax=Tortispora caseinolytica NRRL Y-17796 TaxID=767744 RepID=A0A1E4TF58_9ASCO|nr:hypothetical protein CANCADRAFT_106047 [Tortispora caseinolytica NRRL Y-17796]
MAPSSADSHSSAKHHAKRRPSRIGKHATGMVKLVPVLLKEATVDSPSFRAVVSEISNDIEHLDRWIDGSSKALVKLHADTDGLQDSINLWLSKLVPIELSESLISPGSTLEAWVLFASSSKSVWLNTLNFVSLLEPKILEPLLNLQKSLIRHSREIRKHFEVAQSRYDSTLARYMSQSKLKEASALREDAFQVFEAFKTYSRLSLDYAIRLVNLKIQIDKTMTHMLRDVYAALQPYLGVKDQSFAAKSQNTMARIAAYFDHSSPTQDRLFKELEQVRKDLELYSLDKSPSRDLIDYYHYTIPSLQPPPPPAEFPSPPNSPESYNPHGPNDASENNNETRVPSKPAHARQPSVPLPSTPPVSTREGWVFLKILSGKPARAYWVRRWCFVQNGMFGFLAFDGSRSLVEESEKIGVLLCNAKANISEDRRFCFDVITKNVTFTLQAENQNDLVRWLDVFQYAKSSAVEQKDSSLAFSIIPPLFQEFAISQSSASNTISELSQHETGKAESPPAADVTQRIRAKTISGTQQTLQTIINAGQLLTGHQNIPNIMGDQDSLPMNVSSSRSCCTPIRTAGTDIAITVSLSVIRPRIPNAIDANIWGIVSDFERVNEANFGISTASTDDSNTARSRERSLSKDDVLEWDKYFPALPSCYPTTLRGRLAVLRAIYPFVPHTEYVLLYFSCIWNPSETMDIPSTFFVTNGSIYIYVNTAGFTSFQQIRLSDIIVITGKAGTLYDTLEIITERGAVGVIYTYTVAGNIIHASLSLIHENCFDGSPLSDAELEKILSALHGNLPPSTRPGWNYVHVDHSAHKANNSPSSHSEEQNAQNDARTVMNNRIKRHLARSNLVVPTHSTLTDRILSRWKGKTIQSDEEIYYVNYRKIVENTFAYPAKAVFLLICGDSSTFAQRMFSKFVGAKVNASPWVSIPKADRQERGLYERTFSFEAIVQDILLQNHREVLSHTQNIELIDDNSEYIVTEVITPTNFPLRERYVILLKQRIYRKSRASCVVEGMAGIQWIRPPPTLLHKVVVEELVIRALVGLSSFSFYALNDELAKLGRNHVIERAYRLYGDIGRDSNTGTRILRDKHALQEHDDDIPHYQVYRRAILFYVYLYIKLVLSRLIFERLGKAFEIVSSIADKVTTHAILSSALFISLIVNFVLMHMNGQAFYMNKWTQQKLAETDLESSIWCKTFQRLQTSRDSLGRKRNEYAIALRLLDEYERDIIGLQYESFVREMRLQCLSYVKTLDDKEKKYAHKALVGNGDLDSKKVSKEDTYNKLKRCQEYFRPHSEYSSESISISSSNLPPGENSELNLN